MQGIYFILTITDPARDLELLRQVASTGITAVQLRAKQGIDIPTARLMRQICKDEGILCIVNDHIALALEIDADGVHLGQSDTPIPAARQLLGPSRIIGATAPTSEQIEKAAREGADHVGVGHVFPTTTKKKDGPPLGIAGIQAIIRHSPLPVVAIGGLHAGALEAIYRAGASSAAVCAAIAHAPDPHAAALELVVTWNRVRLTAEQPGICSHLDR